MTEASRLPELRIDAELSLRHLLETDAAAVLELFGDPDVTRMMAIDQLSDVEEALRFIADVDELFHDGSLYQWGIDRLGEIVGTFTLADIDRQHRRAEVGFAVACRYWGQGIVSKTLPVAIDYAFGDLGLHRLEADVDPRNEASLRVLMRHGFQREGVMRQRYFQDDAYQDGVILGLLSHEWRTDTAT